MVYEDVMSIDCPATGPDVVQAHKRCDFPSVSESFPALAQGGTGNVKLCFRDQTGSND